MKLGEKSDTMPRKGNEIFEKQVEDFFSESYGSEDLEAHDILRSLTTRLNKKEKIEEPILSVILNK